MFGDGGTTFVSCELPDETVLMVYKPPHQSVLLSGRKPQIFAQVYFADDRPASTHFIAVRSALEHQLVALLKNAKIECKMTRIERMQHEQSGRPLPNMAETGGHCDEIQQFRDKIVSFVQSQEYVNLNKTPAGG